MSRFFDARLADMQAYTPGEQPREREYIKLNTNELPYPPSPLVQQRVNGEEVAKLHLYPDPTAAELRKAVAKMARLSPEQVFLSNGSDEILSFAFMAYGKGGFAFPDISYGFYRVYAELYGVPYTEIPLNDDFSLLVEAFCAVDANIVLANPNAPTGMSITCADVERILQAHPDRVVIIDEAYVDFGGESCLVKLHEYDNLLIVRTFSKSRALAGGRLGFAFGSPELIADLEKIKYSTNPYNINRLTQIAGTAAIEDEAYFCATTAAIIRTRTRVSDILLARGYTVLPSHTNFLFAAHPRIGGEALYTALRERGILVRHFSAPRTKDYVRISIGTDEQMDALLEALDEMEP